MSTDYFRKRTIGKRPENRTRGHEDIEDLNLDSRLHLAESDVSAVETNSRTVSDRSRFRSWVAIPLFTAVLLIPCFWQSRIQSADLGSHIYNAWLASQIKQGKLPGLWIASQSNNILFDLMLESLLERFGPDLAQRLAVSLSVLIFGWGALLFIFRVGGRNWWFAAPCVAMLAYGFIFHIGFFNFYLSMGLCLWYLAFFWESSWRIRALAAPLLIVAWLAHPFPVVWAVGIAAYVAVAKLLGARGRGLLLVVGMGLLIFLRYTLTHRFRYQWSLQQAFYITGATQLAVFGRECAAPLAGLLFIWLRQLRQIAKRNGAAHVLLTVPLQLWLLNAAAVSLVPNQIMFPHFAREFGYITTRLSFGVALLMCAVLAEAPLSKLDKIALLTVSGLFFGLVYQQERHLNRLENRIDAVIQTLPPMRRVIWAVPEQSLYWLCFQHDVERACIGRCLSYGNYEASSGQFRVRARPNNGIVLSDHVDVDAVRTGSYIVQAHDLPIQLIYPCGTRFENVCSHPLTIGALSGTP